MVASNVARPGAVSAVRLLHTGLSGACLGGGGGCGMQESGSWGGQSWAQARVSIYACPCPLHHPWRLFSSSPLLPSLPRPCPFLAPNSLTQTSSSPPPSPSVGVLGLQATRLCGQPLSSGVPVATPAVSGAGARVCSGRRDIAPGAVRGQRQWSAWHDPQKESSAPLGLQQKSFLP